MDLVSSFYRTGERRLHIYAGSLATKVLRLLHSEHRRFHVIEKDFLCFQHTLPPPVKVYGKYVLSV